MIPNYLPVQENQNIKEDWKKEPTTNGLRKHFVNYLFVSYYHDHSM